MIYLDNSATTKCSPAAIEAMKKTLETDFGNPSSLHGMGVSAEQYLRDTRAAIAKSLHVKDKEIIFTSGGTEANNLGLTGTALAYRRSGMHIITTPIEHPSVKNTLNFLKEAHGYEIEVLPVDRYGIIDLRSLSAAIREDTILVTIMHVNNEIGTIEPIAEAGSIIKQKNPGTQFFVDAVQSYGKLPINPGKMNIDLLSASGHKIHGPKGSGFLYKGEKVKYLPLIYGGGQEWGLRSGTENVPAIAGLGAAVEETAGHICHPERSEGSLRQSFINKISKIEGVTVNGPTDPQNAAPHIISVSVEDVRSEVLLHALEDEGIYVSAGSACSSHKRAPSDTLSAIGLSKSLLECTIRLSMSVNTTEEEMDEAAEKMEKLIPRLRRYTRK